MKNKALKIKLSLSGLFMIIALFLTHSYISIAALAAAALHELGHIAAAKLCKIPLGELKLGIFGAALTPISSSFSYKKEILLCLAGPLVNLFSAMLIYPFGHSKNEFISLFFSASLFLGLLNLLPIKDFDGGRILSCILSYIYSPTVAWRVLKILSFILIFSLWTLSIYLLLKLASSLSLFVFSLSLFSKIFISDKESI